MDTAVGAMVEVATMAAAAAAAEAMEVYSCCLCFRWQNAWVKMTIGPNWMVASCFGLLKGYSCTISGWWFQT